jgi:endogenous inhibitor of DNA gyrase (YacG/DUF329 family)
MSAAQRKAMVRTFISLGGRCPQCGLAMNHNQTSPRCATADHILPRWAGGRDTIHGGTRNLRPMCADCNGLTDKCGQCIAALACAAAVAQDSASTTRTVVSAWRMGIIAEAGRVMPAV